MPHVPPALPGLPAATHRVGRERLAALDVLRGAAVAGMIVVNNPGNWGAVLPPLQHAAWLGWTAADLVFPFFITIMGVAVGLTLPHRVDDAPATVAPGPIRRRIGTRALTLVALGLLLNAAATWPDVTDLRVPGVLQRIGLTYAAAAWIALETGTRGLVSIAVALALGHWILLTMLPFDGAAPGTLLPDANVARWLDRAVLDGHVLSPATDPEGIAGTLPAVSTALAGVVAGRWLRLQPRVPATALRLLGAGSVLTVAGLTWSTVWPLNKTIWTGSFAAFTAGLCLCALAVAYGGVDLRVAPPAVRRALGPFEALGANALIVYVGSEMVARLLDRPIVAWGQAAGASSLKAIVYWDGLVPWVGDAGGPVSSLLYGLAYAAVWTAAAGVLRGYGIRLRV
ncbi:MAG: acyltransferase family protein [Vicinamibacterales bacterium]